MRPFNAAGATRLESDYFGGGKKRDRMRNCYNVVSNTPNGLVFVFSSLCRHFQNTAECCINVDSFLDFVIFCD